MLGHQPRIRLSKSGDAAVPNMMPRTTMDGERSQPGIHNRTPLKAKMTEKKSGPVTQGKGSLTQAKITAPAKPTDKVSRQERQFSKKSVKCRVKRGAQSLTKISGRVLDLTQSPREWPRSRRDGYLVSRAPSPRRPSESGSEVAEVLPDRPL